MNVDHLSVSYGQSQVIPDLSFSVKTNEIVAVMGRNGMGKTTLFKAMIGILPARAGRVDVCGVDVTREEPYSRVAKGPRVCAPGPHGVPHLTVEENIEAGLRSRKERVSAEIYEFFPVLQQMKKRRGGNLSGGQQQQLAIARALASRPKVLLLDEPTEGIQPSIIKESGRDSQTHSGEVAAGHRGFGAGAQLRALGRGSDPGHRTRPHRSGELPRRDRQRYVGAAAVSLMCQSPKGPND